MVQVGLTHVAQSRDAKLASEAVMDKIKAAPSHLNLLPFKTAHAIGQRAEKAAFDKEEEQKQNATAAARAEKAAAAAAATAAQAPSH